MSLCRQEGVVEQMKVQSVNSFQMNPYRQSQPISAKGEGDFGKVKDRIVISNEAKLLQDVSGFEKERADRIAQIIEQVQNGEYHLDIQTIANSMYQFYRGR